MYLRGGGGGVAGSASKFCILAWASDGLKASEAQGWWKDDGTDLPWFARLGASGVFEVHKGLSA